MPRTSPPEPFTPSPAKSPHLSHVDGNRPSEIGMETNMCLDTNRPGAASAVPGGPEPTLERPEKRPEPPTHTPAGRGHPNLDRAHKPVDGIVEAAPGAPRSGSA